MPLVHLYKICLDRKLWSLRYVNQVVAHPPDYPIESLHAEVLKYVFVSKRATIDPTNEQLQSFQCALERSA